MKQLFLIMTVILCISSCEESFLGNENKKASDYMPLEIGNYWIYETLHEQVDGSSLSTYDTLRINRDTVVRGHSFSIIEGTKFGLDFRAILRHDDYNLVNQKGNILLDGKLSGNNLMDSTFVSKGDTVYSVHYNTRILDKDDNIETPAGEFDDVLVHTGHFSVPNATSATPLDVPAYYAKNVGLVEDNNFWISNGLKSKMVLIDYQVK